MTDLRAHGDGAADPSEDEDELYVYVPEEPAAWRKASVVGLVVVLLLVGLILGLGGWLWTQLNPRGDQEAVTLTVPEDATLTQIAGLLEERGVIGDATLFRYYARFRELPDVQAGEYDGLTTNASADDVLARLRQGPLPPRFATVTFPEGLWLTDIRARILETFPEMTAAELDLALASVRSAYQPDGVSLEGLLLPATYEVPEAQRADEVALVTQMAAAFDATANGVDLNGAAARLSEELGVEVTPYDVIVVASLIEEEAKVPADRARIARVIYNRLADGEPLGIDATVIYAKGSHTETLTQSDLQIDSPYNTRRFAGLPPTPIAAAGAASLQAAAAPEPGPWRYYVLADASGAHYFTDSYRDFLRAVEESREKGLL